MTSQIIANPIKDKPDYSAQHELIAEWVAKCWAKGVTFQGADFDAHPDPDRVRIHYQWKLESAYPRGPKTMWQSLKAMEREIRMAERNPL